MVFGKYFCMDREERNRQYLAYVAAKSPKSKTWPSLFYAFLFGGLICSLGQAISDTLVVWFPAMTEVEVASWMLVVIIFITCILTGLGVFDDIARIAGAGTIVPITGFANSICSSAMEFKREGIIFGMCAKMFLVAGPVIITAIISSILVGVAYLFF